jgi:ornithine cyclodeaminase/alanine dehydrogenase-like protein (mu-crystallin family)
MQSLAPYRQYVKPLIAGATAYIALKYLDDQRVRTGAVIGAGLVAGVSGAQALGLADVAKYVPVLAGDDDDNIRIPVSSPEEAAAVIRAMYPDTSQDMQIVHPQRQIEQQQQQVVVPQLSGYHELEMVNGIIG